MSPEKGINIVAGTQTAEWQVYILLCSDNSLYTGITTDVRRRFSQHCDGHGAKYFRGRAPKRLVYLETGHDRSSASRREIAIKKLPRNKKWQLIDNCEEPFDPLTA
jgi:putative endonuclease